jgi:hypothetical protein
VTFVTYLAIAHPDDRKPVRETVAHAYTDGGGASFRVFLPSRRRPANARD